jgi:hypothetical protein
LRNFAIGRAGKTRNKCNIQPIKMSKMSIATQQLRQSSCRFRARQRPRRLFSITRLIVTIARMMALMMAVGRTIGPAWAETAPPAGFFDQSPAP